MWHGGVYNIGFAVTYALAPLVIYYFDLSVFSDTARLKNKIICAILMFLSFFVFWLFAVVVFLLIFYYLIRVLFRKELFIKSLKHLLILGLIFVPLASFIIFTILHEFLNNAGDINASFVPTFQYQQGGMWYSFLMLFSWGIYNVWTPRSLYPFGQYFLSSAYRTVTLLIYSLIVLGIGLLYFEQQSGDKTIINNLKIFLKNKKNIFIIIFSLLLLLSIFFAKGAQPPFGGLFVFFYNHVPFFSVFRSADHRFGFAIVFAVSLLLIIASQKYKTYLFVLVLLLLSIAQTYPLYFGDAVRGENIENKYYDRIVKISTEYKQLADLLNRQKNTNNYVFTTPSVDYGVYNLNSKGTDHLVGQDLLPKLINKPFVYLSTSSGMDANASRELKKVIEDENFDELQNFPIEYIIFRKDVMCQDCVVLTKGKLDRHYTEILANDLFTVYKINDFSPLINIKGKNVSYKMISPIMFKAKLENIKNQEQLNLMFSFNKNWHIYIDSGDKSNYLFEKSVFDNTHRLAYKYANTWTIDTNYIKDNYKNHYELNKDGTITFSAIIYYQPQSWYYFYGVISTLLLISYLIILYVLRREYKND